MQADIIFNSESSKLLHPVELLIIMVPCENIVNFNAFVTNDLILSKPHYFGNPQLDRVD